MDMITLAMAKSYTDSQRLGWSETGFVEYLPTTKHELMQYDESSGASVFLSTGDVIRNAYYALRKKTEDGKKEIPVTVEIDGTAYATTAICGYDEAFLTYNVSLGNPGGFRDPTALEQGEPFSLGIDGPSSVLVLLGESQNHTVSIYQETETIHTIDPKYLPNMGSGSGLPVVELVSSGVSGLVSEEVNALLHEYAEQGTPIVAKLVVDGMGNVATSVLNYQKQNGYLMFTGYSLFDLCTTQDGVFEVRID